MGGLLIAKMIVDVPGVTIIGPHEATWAHLDPGDGQPRTNAPTQIFIHRTIGDVPDKILPGVGPPGGDERTAEYWQKDSKHSGAHIVVSASGRVACLADLVLWEAYHATVSNQRSIGIEMHEEAGGALYQAQIDSTVAIVLAICETLGIQLQVPRLPYTGHPLKRMLDGGSTVIGVLGHRDNTEQRGRWDPGDSIFAALRGAGAEAWDINAGEDILIWKARQVALVAQGHPLTVDGIPGHVTTTALLAEGYRGGVFALGKHKD